MEGILSGLKYIPLNHIRKIIRQKDLFFGNFISGKRMGEANTLLYSKQEWFKTQEEMNALFADVPEALQNTTEILDKVEIYSINHAPILPDFPLPEGFDNEDDYLRYLVYEGAKERWPDMDEEQLNTILESLRNLQHCNIGVIELDASLDIDIVTDIFIRINSKGTALSQGDFVMSKIAADEIHGGNTLRKVVDYFAHLCKDGTFYNKINEKDHAFAASSYFSKLEWLKDDKETVYDPECDDVLRVAFMHRCKRAKLADLVAMLSGRDFETREFKEEIVENTYKDLEAGVNNVINGYNFTQFMLAIRSAGFTSKKLVNSVMAIDFAYAVYLLLQETKEIPVDEIKSLVQRWYVLSVLTGRYSASPETAFAKDIRAIGENGVKATLKSIEDATLSDAFWNVQLNQNLTFVSSINPTYQVFLAAQNFFKKDSLLSHIPVGELVNLGGDIHHIFPKQYLVDNGYDKHEYNQVANYAYLDTPINIKVGKKAPKVYLNEALDAIRSIEDTSFKSIKSEAEFYKNLEDNCIPVDILEMDHSDYQAFLEARRIKMTELIKTYYYSL